MGEYMGKSKQNNKCIYIYIYIYTYIYIGKSKRKSFWKTIEVMVDFPANHGADYWVNP